MEEREGHRDGRTKEWKQGGRKGKEGRRHHKAFAMVSLSQGRKETREEGRKNGRIIRFVLR